MPLTKRQRVGPAPASARVNKPKTPTTRAQTGIQQFGRVSKATAAPSESKKRKAVSQEADQEVELAKPSSRKKQVQRRPPPDTPTKGANRLLAGLGLSRPPKPPKFDSVTETRPLIIDTPPTSPCSSGAPSLEDDKSADDLPQGVRDLISLHTSFLTALSLHYAHNGTASPVDVRNLTPSISKVWGLRKVTLDDLRRSLAIMQISASSGRPSPALQARTFNLSDYGHGKICLEQHESKKRKRNNSFIPAHIDERALNALFAAELTRRWSEYRTKITPNSKSPASVNYFIIQLPLAEVAQCASLAKVAPLLAKGQRRLADLKAGAIKAQAAGNCFAAAEASDKENENVRPASVKSGVTKSSISSTKTGSTITSSSADKENTKPASVPAPPAAASRATSLLDRILAKQAHAASLPAGPTPQAHARQAALHRCEDVLATLSLLATTSSSTSASPRVSFPLPRLVRDVQASTRSPLSAEEVRKVVEVLAEEIVPGYVGLVKMGALEAVVVDRARKVGTGEVRKKLVAAGAE